MTIKVFLINYTVDLANEELEKGNEYDLQAMLLEAISKGIEVKLCKSCLDRCGLNDGRIRPEAAIGTMPNLVEWIAESESILTF